MNEPQFYDVDTHEPITREQACERAMERGTILCMQRVTLEEVRKLFPDFWCLPQYTETPQYTHDCTAVCIFLGRFKSKHPPFHYDLYIHPGKNPAWTNLLARWGNEGSEYSSVNPSYIDGPLSNDFFVECKRRAREKNLL